MTATTLLAIAIGTAAIGQSSDLTYVRSLTEDLTYPARVAGTPDGGVLVTEPPTKQVFYFDVAGTLAATYSVSQGPLGIAVHDDGRVFVSREDGAIGVYDSGFVLIGTVSAAPLGMSAPNDLAYDEVMEELYAVDSDGNRVLVFEESAANVWTLVRAWGMGGHSMGQFAMPRSIAIDASRGHVIVTDADNFRVQVFDVTGVLQFKFGYRMLYTRTSEVAWLARTEGAAVDACGNIYLTDALMGTLRVFGPNGKEIDPNNLPMLTYGTGPTQLRVPCDVAVSHAGVMFVADTNNGAVKVYDVGCSASSVAGLSDPTAGVLPTSDGARFAGKSETAVRAHKRNAAPVSISFPDNPAEVAQAIAAGDYVAAFDFNRDRVVDLADLQLAVNHFGAGTIEDFMAMGGGVAAHPGVAPPHILDMPNRCGRCHSMDGAPEGGMLTAAGQMNLCESCHSAGKIAGSAWIGGGHLENSHPWGVAATPSPGSDLALHMDNGKIRCGTCHEPHEDLHGDYLRAEIYETTDVASPPSPAPPAAPWQITKMTGELCIDCHVEVAEWMVAGHSHEEADPFIHYNWAASNRAACRQCHSGYGYIDFAAGLTSANQRGDLRVVDCLVCHSTHGAQQSENLLRIYDDVTLPGGLQLTDVGGMATCMACHNGRSLPADPIAPGVSTPHYALGGVMFEGVNGVAFGYTISQNTDHQSALTCMSCHMAPSPAPGNPGAGKVGGHTFNLKVHNSADPDFGFENAVNACGGCHTGLTTLNRPAGGDFDGDGTVEGVQDETQGLMDLVFDEIIAHGAVFLGSHPYWVTTGVAPADLASVEGSIWNWEYVDNSGDLGVKNTGYAVGLLQVSYLAMTGGPAPGWAPRYVTP
jgi:predicted CXXCH cytochrome family protein